MFRQLFLITAFFTLLNRPILSAATFPIPDGQFPTAKTASGSPLVAKTLYRAVDVRQTLQAHFGSSFSYFQPRVLLNNTGGAVFEASMLHAFDANYSLSIFNVTSRTTRMLVLQDGQVIGEGPQLTNFDFVLSIDNEKNIFVAKTVLKIWPVPSQPDFGYYETFPRADLYKIVDIVKYRLVNGVWAGEIVNSGSSSETPFNFTQGVGLAGLYKNLQVEFFSIFDHIAKYNNSTFQGVAYLDDLAHDITDSTLELNGKISASGLPHSAKENFLYPSRQIEEVVNQNNVPIEYRIVDSPWQNRNFIVGVVAINYDQSWINFLSSFEWLGDRPAFGNKHDQIAMLGATRLLRWSTYPIRYSFYWSVYHHTNPYESHIRAPLSPDSLVPTEFPMLYDAGNIVTFGTDRGMCTSVNNFGVAVGYTYIDKTTNPGVDGDPSEYFTYRPMVWEGGMAFDLNERLLSPQEVPAPLTKAYALSDDNYILAENVTSPSLGAYLRNLQYLVPLSGRLLVDANRDGQIKLPYEESPDVTTADLPYRFWSNDDDDELVDSSILGVYSELEEDDKKITDTSKEDWRNNVIDVPRDLEDFARIHLYTQGLNDAFRNGDLYLGLKWADTGGTTPAIKLYRSKDTTGSSSYLFNPAVAAQQFLKAAIVDARYPGYSGGNFQSDHTLIESTTEAFVIPSDEFSSFLGTGPTKPFLFEGCKAGKGQLKIVILKKEGANYTEIGEGPGVWLDLKKPNEFVERFTCGDGDLQAVGALTRHAQSATFAAPVTDEEKDYVLYVHGYNMQEFEKQRWLETAYKRLWHLGYKGRVGGFSWPCSQSALPFDASEEKAWQSAVQLKAHLANLKAQGYRVHVIAHSQGNVVMGEALRQAGAGSALVRTYIASQAAVAASCYKENVPLMPNPGQETPDVYGIYPPTGLPYFDGSVMSGAASRYVNFHNRNDYALSSTSGNLVSWEKDQQLKPNQGWGYNAVDGFFESNTSGGLTSRGFPNDRFRIFSYGAEAKSLALGTIPTGGVFSSFINLQTSYGYGNQHIYHSGQFRSSMSERFQYWDGLLTTLGIPSLAP